MSLEQQFVDAQARVKTLVATPATETLLLLYALFKQATVGDASGKRPGLLDLKGRAKFDAWSGKKGIAKDEAMKQYVALVDRLVTRE